jgi:hydrogenase/urease accessory protein HupE
MLGTVPVTNSLTFIFTMLSGHIFGEKIKSLGNTDMEYLTGFFLYIMSTWTEFLFYLPCKSIEQQNFKLIRYFTELEIEHNFSILMSLLKSLV